MVDIAPKHLELLRDMAPKLRRVAWLTTGASAGAQREVLEIAQSHAPRVGMQIVPFEARTEVEFEDAFARMVKQQTQAVVVPTGSRMIAYRKLVADLALKHRLPCLGYNAEYVDAGFVLSYGADLLEIYRRSAIYVDKSLKCAQPADLPIELPTQFELVINKKAAQALGLTIARVVELRADRYIA